MENSLELKPEMRAISSEVERPHSGQGYRQSTMCAVTPGTQRENV